MTYFYPIFRKNFLFALLFLSLFLIAAVPMIMAPGLNNPEAVGPFLNDAFPSGVSSGPGNVTFDDYASNLVFNTVMGAAQAPRSNRFYVIERNGKIFSFDKTQTNPAMTLFRNMENIVWKGQDSGLLGIAFHPDFNQVGSPNKNYLYVFYVNETAGVRYIRVSRLTKQNNGDVFVPNSEQILINQRLDFTGSNLHRGGGLVFGNDGFLYISIGDLGAMNQSQNITDRLLGGILRIDVDKRGGGISHPIRRSLQQLGQGTTDNYFIPNDNPWISTNGSNFEEYYAIGCRSPHKMSKDVATGTIFIGNVGSNSGNKKEEINVLSKGANFGWPFREGTTDRPDLMARPSNIIGQLKDPMLFYQHGGGSVCIIGGYVYRGSQYPALQGKYVFGDFGSRNIWSVNLDGSNQQLIASIPNQFPTFAQDTDGEIYIGRMGGHPLLRLNVANNPGGNGSIPQFLSQTGAFADVANLVPAQGVIPYDVNTSLWSDGSEKYRWAVIPNDGTHNVVAEQVDFDDRGDWDFPRGTVFIKHFELALDERNPSQTKKLETRFIILDGPGSFYGLTYKWNNAGTDAELLSNGLSETYNIIDQSGGSRSQTWRYPSRSECLTCHTQASGGVLGPQTSQFNGGMVYPSTGINANQLETWAHLGIFKYSRQFVQPINATEISRYITSRSINDNSASLEQRARSYLDANCSSCHRPNGGPRAEFDARIESGLDLQNLINGPVINELGIAGAKLVFPGNAEKSIIYKRINQANTGDAMPPLAKNRVHTEGANLIRDWINALPASGGGWNAKYYSDTGLQNLAFERVDRAIDFNWDDVSPKDGFQSNNYSVSWTTQLTARFAENYTFALKADDGVRMWVDGQKIIDDWSVHPPQFALGSVFLSPGAHDIKVEYFQGGGNARVSLYWQSPSQSWELVPAMYTNPGGAPPPPPPGGGNGLQATYYNNIDFTGNSISRVDPTINFNWGTGSPDAAIGNDTYSARWEGSVEATTSGNYTFYTRTDDGARLWVNGNLIIDKWRNQGPTEWTGTINMTAGQRVPIKMEYYENGGGAVAQLSWSGPGQGKQIIPSSQLYPGNSPTPPGPTPQGLIAHWPLDNNANDVIGDANGTLSGGANLENDAQRGQVLGIRQNSHHVLVSPKPQLQVGNNGDDFSIAFWMNLQQANTGAWRSVMHKGAANSQRTFAMWMRPNDNKLHFRISTSASSNEGGDSQGAIAVNAWTHIAYVKEGQKLKLYLNGTLDREINLRGTVVSNNGNLYFGDTPWYNPAFSKMDDIRMYGSALNSTEVRDLAGGGTPPPPPGGNGSGLQATYYDNMDFTGNAITRVDPAIDFNWGLGSPDSRIGNDTYSARWEGFVEAPTSGSYTFYSNTDDGVRLWVNGTLIIDKWINQAPREWTGTANMTAGQRVSIKMEYYENGGGAVAQLSWSGPGQGKQIIPSSRLFPSGGTPPPPPPTAGNPGLQATYYDNMDFTGTSISRVDQAIDFNWGTGSPDSRIGNDTYSARWEGFVEAPTSGSYTFYTRTDDGVRLWVNGNLIIEKWINQSPREWTGTINLNAGQKVPIKMEYYENGGGAVAQLSWSGPGQGKQIIPSSRLSHGSSTNPPSSGPIAAGTYTIKSRHSNKFLMVAGNSQAAGANIHQWSQNNVANQQWRVEPLSSGAYRITSVHSNKVMEAAGAGTPNGTNLQQGNNSNASHQQWEIEAGPTGYYFIKNLNSNNYIDVAAYSQADGGNIHIWGKHGGNNQQWEFLPVSSAKIVSLNAKNRPASVNLRWELNEYSPNTRFEVEKSIDGIIFGRIAEITTAKHGIQDVSFSYGDAEIENMENETIIYRIKMTNLTSGKTRHSSEITVKLESKRGLYLKAYPNPMRDYFTLEYSSAGESKPEIIIYAKLGQVVHRQKLDSFEGRLRISTTDWAKGMYYLRLKNASTEELLKLSKSE